MIGPGVHNIFGGIRYELGRIAASAFFQFLGPGLLDDEVGAHVSGDEQGIDRFAIGAQLGLNHDRLGIPGFDGFDVVLIGSTGGSVVLDMGSPGVGDIFSGHRGAIAPLGSLL